MSSVNVSVEDVFDPERVERHHVVLAGVILAGLLLRAWGLGAESLWFDEIFRLDRRRIVPPEFIAVILPDTDPHPPLYYVLVDLWTGVVGVSDVGLRSLSTALDVGSMGLVYLVARRLYDRRVGLVAAGLFALSPFYVWYGREARMYALAVFLTLASWYLLLRLGAGDRRDRVVGGYLVATIGLVHTHAFATLVVFAQNVYVFGAFAASVGCERRLVRRVGDLSVPGWLRLQTVLGVVSVPYYSLLLHHMFVSGRFEGNVSWVPATSPERLWKIAGTYVGRTVPPVEPWGYESLWAYGPGDILIVVGELATLAALGLAAFALVRTVRDDGDREAFAPAPVLAAWALVPVATLYVLSVFVTPVLYDRFTAMAGVAFLVLVARGLVLLADSRREVAVLGAATLVVLAVPLAGLHAGPQKPQTETAVSIIEANADEGDLVLVSPGWDSTPNYYLEDWHEPPELTDDRDQRPWTSNLPIAGLNASADEGTVRETVGTNETVWLLLSFQTAADRAVTVQSVRAAGYEATRHETLEKIELYRFERTG